MRTEGYADPKAEKTKRNFTVRPEDVAFVGNVDEQELVIFSLSVLVRLHP
jgi:hypothetical protein